MEEFIVNCTVPPDWRDDHGIPGNILKTTVGKFLSFEAAKEKLETMRTLCEKAGREFEGTIMGREVMPWKQVWPEPPLVLEIDMHAQPDSGEVNGEEDFQDEDQYPKMPGIVPDPKYADEWRWKISVDVNTGKILDWKTGTRAEAWYKCSDDIKIKLDDKNLNEGQYVPKFLRPRGDDDNYVELAIDCEGKIYDWNPAKVKKWIEKRKTKK